MLSYELREHDPLPLYEQLYRLIRQDIHAGSLKAGDRLPSRRAMAEHHGISLITVDSAYAQLIDEGYVTAKPRSGYFVSEGLQGMIAASGPVQQQPAAVSAPVMRYLADFTSNETHTEMFPFTIWSRLIRELLSMKQNELMQNPPSGGRMDLRQAIAEHLRSYRGLHVDPEQIIIGAGTEYLYGLLTQLLGMNALFALEEPGYQKAEKVYRSHGTSCVPIPMDREGIRVDLLAASGAEVAHVSPAHHFPTGRVMSAGRRFELLQWAVNGGHVIIEDDYDSEFRLTGLPIPALQSIDHHDRVIYMNTFTKTLASTIRISYMVLPDTLLRRYREQLSFYSCTVSSIEQATLAAFISRGYFEKHLNRTRNGFRRKRDMLLEGIRQRLPAGQAAISEEDAGLHFLLSLNTALDDLQVCRMAGELGLRMRALSAFYRAEPKPAHCFVINYSSVRDEDIDAICEALSALTKRVCGA